MSEPMFDAGKFIDYVWNLREERDTLRTANQLLEGEVARMREALAGLVKINELHNQAVVAVTGKPGGWNDDYLNEARAALSTANGEVTK